jgi:hypothetical protein
MDSDPIAAGVTVPAEAVPLAGRITLVAVHGNGGGAHRFARSSADCSSQRPFRHTFSTTSSRGTVRAQSSARCLT